MKRTTTNSDKPVINSLADSMRKAHKKKKKKKRLEGNTEVMVSTGSTLLDLCISGGRVYGGGVPGSVLLEAFGPEGSGKTVLLTEMGGDVQRKGGDVNFQDPEARLNKTFAKIFDLSLEKDNIDEPDTVVEAFSNIRAWEPKGDGKINIACVDSLAALSTELEMDDKKGDKMGMKRAKDFSAQLRLTCRRLKKHNLVVACSNQIRVNVDAGMFEEQTTTPGGKGVPFYASIRLRFSKPSKIYNEKTIFGKLNKKCIGTKVQVEVYKNSCWEPYHKTDIYIIFNYGIDDIRANLQYVKDHTSNKTYTVDGKNMGVALIDAIHKVEELKLEKKLKRQTIKVWTEVEEKLNQVRKPKRRV